MGGNVLKSSCSQDRGKRKFNHSSENGMDDGVTPIGREVEMENTFWLLQKVMKVLLRLVEETR